tara:strand:+ start:375 stop:1028 length:654 start_codon:yes stop_codon:yes gene_type:complete
MKTTKIKFSSPSKMPCYSWDLQALDDCIGSTDTEGNLVPACTICYATEGFYVMPNAVKLREHNQEDWKRDAWVDEFVYLLRDQLYFRWFSSGDIKWWKLADKILEVMKRTPHCKHWLPTRMLKARFKKHVKIINKMAELPNVSVRFSSDSIDGSYSDEHGSTIIPQTIDDSDSVVVCRAYDRGGKCGECRACWDKNVKLIAYVAHGRKAVKVLRETT